MIEVRNLVKNYGHVEAVRNVSFTLEKEQVLGFLGPNGAGKTTVMKILTGYHFPTSGTAMIDGIQVDDEPVEVKRRIGYLPENVPLYGELTVDEYLIFAADIRRIPRTVRRKAINKSLEACGLTDFRSRKIETLSKGYRQRTGLAQAILHDPPILILDEPTNGLDPNQIIEIRSLIKELGKKKTVILSTHILQEVEAICSQVLIINEGKIAAQGTSDDIAKTLKGGDNWEIVLKGSDAEKIKEKFILPDENITPVSAENLEDGTVRLCFSFSGTEKHEDAPVKEKIFDWAVSNGLKVFDIGRKKLSMEDIFVKLTAEEQKNERLSAGEVRQ